MYLTADLLGRNLSQTVWATCKAPILTIEGLDDGPHLHPDRFVYHGGGEWTR